METLFQDIRYGLRILRKSPGFTAVAIITMALGIGANTALFSIVNTVLLRALPFRDPNHLVKITFNNPGVGLRDVVFSVPELDDLRSRAGVFEEVSVVFPVSVNLTGGKEPDRLEFLAVSPNYFSMLGNVKPQIGRLFGPEDTAQGFAQATVISDGLWRRSFGGDPKIIGRNLRLDGDLYTVVGVLPPGFRHPGATITNDVEIWATAGFSADPFPKPTRDARLLPGAIGRLKPGLNRAQAQAGLNILAGELSRDYAGSYPAKSGFSINIIPLQESLVGDVRPMLLVLMGAVILIALIAAVNIANLLLARASGRQQELAVRVALGADRARVTRMLLTESIILSLIAGVVGILIATGALSFVVQFMPAKIPRLSEVRIDWVVLGFALLISVLSGLVFGLAPALQSARTDIFATIREGARGSGYSKKTGRLRDLLIVSELALAVVLMVGAGLLLRTFWGLLQKNPGFNPAQVVTANIWIPIPNDPQADVYVKVETRAAFIREALRRLAALPGIESAGMTSALPVSNTSNQTNIAIEGRPLESSQDLTAEVISVTPEYLKLMQASLLRGRFVAENDERGKPLVALIDETTAHRYWPGEDPIGKRFRLGQNPSAPWTTVIGLIKDIKHNGLDADGLPHIYRPLYQNPGRAISVAVRTRLAAATLEPQIRREIQALDPNLPVFGVRSMTEAMGESLAPRRFSAELVGVFAAMALLLASIGIYGLLAYMVGQRSNEIGIRMALGARPANIRKLILSKGVLLSGTGIVIGLIFAAIAAPAIRTLLYGVQPFDITVFATVPLILLAVAILASYIPAHRATKVDPIIALRNG